MGNRELNTAAKVITTRKNLCPTIGYLYPDSEKNYLQAMTLDALRDAVKGVDNYKDILKEAPDPLKREDFNVSTRYLFESPFNQNA
jgi:V-type H+-transporting ATPase subunit d